MTFTVGQLLAPPHRVVLVVSMVVLNVVVIPAAAWGIAELFPMGRAGASSALAVITAAATAGRPAPWSVKRGSRAARRGRCGG
jgi:hypothetical protein